VTERRKKMFIKEFSIHLNITKACEKLSLARRTYYRWIKSDAKFKEEIREIIEEIEGRCMDVLYASIAQENENGSPTRGAVDTAKWMINRRDRLREWIIPQPIINVNANMLVER